MGFPGGSAGKESTSNVGDLGLEDPLEKGLATQSSILAWKIPWTCKESDTPEPLSLHFTCFWDNWLFIYMYLKKELDPT